MSEDIYIFISSGGKDSFKIYSRFHGIFSHEYMGHRTSSILYKKEYVVYNCLWEIYSCLEFRILMIVHTTNSLLWKPTLSLSSISIVANSKLTI